MLRNFCLLVILTVGVVAFVAWQNPQFFAFMAGALREVIRQWLYI